MNLSRTSYQQLAITLMLLMGGYTAHAQTDTLRLTEAEALTLATKRNITLQSSRLDVEKARTDKRVNLAKFFPTINLTGQYGYTLKKQVVYFGSEGGSSNPMAALMPSDGIEMGQRHNLSGAITASMPLYSPQLWASLEVDKASVENALEKVRASEVNLRSEVRKAYLGVLLARAGYEVLKASQQQLERSSKDIKLKYDNGLVAEYDLIRIESQAKNLIPNVLQAEQQLRLAKMKLLVLLDYTPETPLELSESLEDYRKQVEAEALDNATTLDLSQNTTLRSLDLSEKTLLAGLKVKQREYLPTLGLSFNYAYNFASDYFRLNNSRRWSPGSTIGLALNIPLYSGGSTKYGIKSLELQREQLRLQKLNVERQLDLQATNAVQQREQALQQYFASREGERLAQKSLDIAQVRYKSGNGTVLELNDAELALRQAQLNLSQAVYNYMIALYELHTIQGK